MPVEGGTPSYIRRCIEKAVRNWRWSYGKQEAPVIAPGKER